MAVTSSIPPAHYRFFAVAAAALTAIGLVVALGDRPVAPTPARVATVTDAIPDGALVVVTADLARVRASGFADRLRAESRDVPGLGDRKSVV